MTPRQRLLAVYRGQTPDRVPALADLSYWYAAHGGSDAFLAKFTADGALGRSTFLGGSGDDQSASVRRNASLVDAVLALT